MPRTNDSRTSNAGPAPSAVVRTDNPKDRYASIESAIVSRQDDIALTLAKGIDQSMFIKVALQAITRTPKLLECTPRSFVLALRDAAELGLMPSGLLGEGYLVPYRNHGIMEAQFQPGYLGLVKLARQSGEVLDVEARVVRERDTLDIVFGSNGHVSHRPWIEGRDGPEDPGAYQGAWFRAELKGGVEHVGWMSMAQIEAVRKRSKAADTGPWVTDWEAMARKTVTRAELKWLPRSVSLQRAMEQEDVIEGQADTTVRIIKDASSAQTRLLARAGVAHDDEQGATTPPEDGDQPDGQEAVSEPSQVICGGQSSTGAPCIREEGHPAEHWFA